MTGRFSKLSGPIRVTIVICALIGIYILQDQVLTYTSDAYVAADIVVLAPEVSGFVKEIPVLRNQKVKAGQLLIQIDPEPLRLTVEQYKAQEGQARSSLERAEATVRITESNLSAALAAVSNLQTKLERYSVLEGQGFIPRQTYDDLNLSLVEAEAQAEAAKDNVEAANRQVEQMKASVKAASAQLAIAQYNLNHTSLTAHEDGVVGSYEVMEGNYVLAGSPQVALITNDNWRIVANLIERHAARMKPGMTVYFQVSSDPWRIHRGKVRSIGRGISRVPYQEPVLPFISLTTSWIRLSQRFPVEIDMGPYLKTHQPLHGGDARIFAFH
ncbi:HlyD family secretion protein [Flexibacterium corallicola]|uniref:HlyD family secretion protein n=1 Tax=Flexibacterium corallicola TaxID=3037259 RepID=UPI00286F07C7|nr:HlyD family secretion protein [Pseudovibrio sp. M1P-2-3]